jgi:N-acetylmuramoyl-L-alanine amidase
LQFEIAKITTFCAFLKIKNTQLKMKRLLALFIALVCINSMVFCQKKNAGQVRTIVIDAGHGGDKPGAVGKKSQEKTLTLQMALKLGKLIEDNCPDVKIIYTRTTDVDVALAERARLANKAKADLFLSIHCNSWTNPTPTGVETYVMGLSQSKANMEVAKKENADILLEKGYKDNSDYQGFDPNSPESYVMFAMYQNAYLDKSLDFAGMIQE